MLAQSIFEKKNTPMNMHAMKHEYEVSTLCVQLESGTLWAYNAVNITSHGK